VHRAGQQHIKGLPELPLPPLSQLIAAVEAVAALARPTTATAPAPRVRAIALNTALLDQSEAAAALAETAAATQLPCHDPVRFGGEGLLAELCN
jgi:uncharacterized NAD-dependent epimerase/dehydratase family protein